MASMKSSLSASPLHLPTEASPRTMTIKSPAAAGLFYFTRTPRHAGRPGSYVLANVENTVVTIEKDEIERVTHPEGVHTGAGLDEQPFRRSGLEWLATQQTAQTCPGIGGMPHSRDDAAITPVERAAPHRTPSSLMRK